MEDNPRKLKKYKVRLFADSKKTQGLQPGDIVRRQYLNAPNGIGSGSGLEIIYTLMCVLEVGTDTEVNAETGSIEHKPYFIGAVIQGDNLIADTDDPDYQRQILDFARITNLFDLNRSGALYLTASDDEAPYLDVIDGIGRNASFCWPENLESESFSDPKSQYVVEGERSFYIGYSKHDATTTDYNRVISLERHQPYSNVFEGLKQDFYESLRVGEGVVVSYRAKASVQTTVGLSLEYVTGTDFDAKWTEDFGKDWKYYFRIVTITKSSRHLRSLKLSLENLCLNESVKIADFNIIPLSSITNFSTASALRLGKLDGVVDPVFGRLSGYGAYMDKLYASQTAHISGTLTAGDENGFGATFYAGKIHRNSFRNSTDVNFISNVTIDWVTDENQQKIKNFSITNPTGVGHVYRSNNSIIMVAQDNSWLIDRVGKRYCFSFWIYAKQKCTQIGIRQNGRGVGTIQIPNEDTHKWQRVHVTFDLLEPQNPTDNLIFELIPIFGTSDFDAVGNETNPDEAVYFFTAPQLESGEIVTQYQPTDSQLNYTDSYGAWFAEGGIGGTIQHPLIELNKDGEGAIEARGSGFRLNTDGSGHLAKKNIRWNADGKVTFGKDVTLNWDNLDTDTQDELANRYMRIVGDDTFTIIGREEGGNESVYSPASITLSLEEVGFTSTSSQRQWYFKTSQGFLPIPEANGSIYVVTPDSSIWNGESSITVKCVVNLNQNRVYTDTFTVKKQYVEGYRVVISSSRGTSFKNGACQTILTAHVYYQGQLVDLNYARNHFIYTWKRYKANNLSVTVPFNDTDANDESPETIALNYELDGSDVFVCEISVDDTFDYSFPVMF